MLMKNEWSHCYFYWPKVTMIFIIWNSFPASFVSSYLIIFFLFPILVLKLTLTKHPDCPSNLENWPNLQYNGG